MKENKYDYDWLGGPLYRCLPAASIKTSDALETAHRAYIIDVLVSDPDSQAQERRQYFAINLTQAVTRAAELQVRLRDLGYDPILIDIKRLSDQDVDDFFRAIDRMESRMPKAFLMTQSRNHQRT